MNLYFLDSENNKRFITKVETFDDAIEEVKMFCNERDFNIRYYRLWGNIDDKGITIDVGSWTEFFQLEKDMG